eukprot:GGOE01043758.1.p1 GENE.GGOE01043758.1~~GGOE01043758.1.p1  ORF type:complete len:474 (-),score=133.43 GGOE01043758.1:36-1457(-)
MVQVMTVPSSNLKLLLQPRCLRHCALSDSLDAGHLALEEQTARQAQEMQEMQARHQQEQRYRLRLQGHLLHRKREQEVEALRSKFESALADVVASARAQQAEAALALADLEAALQDEQMAAILARDLLCTAQSQADHFRHQYSAERRRLRASQEEAEKLWLQLQGMQLDTQRMVEALRRQCLEAIAGQKRAELRCELAASLSSSRPPCASQTPQPHHSTQDRPPSHHSFRAREGKADTTGVANGASAGEESTTSILDLSAWTVHSDDLPLSQAERTLPLSGDRSPATFSELEWALPISTEQRLAHEEQLWQELGAEDQRLEVLLQEAIAHPRAVGSPVLLAQPLPPPSPASQTYSRLDGPGLAPWLDRLSCIEGELEQHRSGLATALARLCQVRRGRQQHPGSSDRRLRDEEASLSNQISELQTKIWNGEKELAAVERRFLHPIEAQRSSPVASLRCADPVTAPTPWVLDPLD